MERSAEMAPGPGRVASWLDVGGDVARDLLNVDWSKTPVGPPEVWPASLATTVRTLLASRFSMWMAWGPDLTFFCNDAYRRDTLGSKYPWALGRPASEVWSEIWPEIGPRIDSVLHTGQATWDESLLLFLERSGYVEETYHTFSYSPLPDDEGRIAGMLCVVTEETERVISERRMATLRDVGNVPAAAAGDARDFLRAAATHLALNRQSLPFTVTYLFDEAGNAELGATTRLPEGHPLAPAEIQAGDPSSPWPLEALLAQQEVVIDDLHGELPTGVSDVPPSQAFAVPLQQVGDRRPHGFLAVGVNQHRPFDSGYQSFIRLIAQRLAAGVGDVLNLESERRRAEQLAELDRAKTAFFSNVSHEFRTPLTLMLAPLEDAMVGSDGMPATQVELVHRNGMRLLKLVNALLDFSRLEAGRMRAEFRPVEVGRLTCELAGTFSDACRRAGLQLRIDTPEPTETAYVDPDLWERIVLNLVSNAFKVTLEGSIAVSTRDRDGSLELAVSDTGPGIPEDELDRLFQRFHRVASLQARSNEGTGIGLALVKELAELHGGTVDVQSTVGEGSRFTVRLPLGRRHLPTEQVIDEAAPVTPSAAALFVEEALGWIEEETGIDGATPQSEARVLVADDNADLRRYLVRLLRPLWQVQTVSDGAEALEQIRRDPPDLLVTDVMMPGLSGFELLRELRRNVRTRELPVIMLSARAGEEAAIEGLEAGADDYLPKPFSGRELVARVRAHLEMAQVRRQAADELRAKSDRLEEALAQLLRSQQLIAAQRDILALIAGGSSLERSLHEIVRWTELIAEPGARASILLLDEESHRLTHGAAPSLPDAYNDAIDGIAIGPAVGSCGTAAFRREPVIVEDIAGDPLWADFRELAAEHGLGACWSVPIAATDGRLVGTFALYHNHPSAPSEEDLRVVELLARTAAVAIERSRDAQARARQLAELQSSLLPRELPPIPGLGVAAAFHPGDRSLEVGGDFYDVFEVEPGTWGFIVGDVCGHGAEAAAVTALTRYTAKAVAARERDPADVLAAVSDALRRSGYDRFCTAVYGRVEPREDGSAHVCLASGGHPAPLLRRADGTVVTMSDHGPLLGVFEQSVFPLLKAVLEPGDALVIYTDGLVERNPLVPEGEALASLLGSLPASSAEELVQAIEHEAIPPVPAAGRDDVAILGLRAGEEG